MRAQGGKGSGTGALYSLTIPRGSARRCSPLDFVFLGGVAECPFGARSGGASPLLHSVRTFLSWEFLFSGACLSCSVGGLRVGAEAGRKGGGGGLVRGVFLISFRGETEVAVTAVDLNEAF